MQLNDEYEAAKKQYFGIGRKSDKQEAECNLRRLYESSKDKTVKAKVTYFLGAILLTDRIKATVQISPQGLTEQQKRILAEGMLLLEEAHKLGSEPASLLLVKIIRVSDPRELNDFEVSVESKSLGKLTICAKEPLANEQTSRYLIPFMDYSREAATLLAHYAKNYIDIIDHLVTNDYFENTSEELDDTATREIFTEDAVFYEFGVTLARSAQASEEDINDPDPNSPFEQEMNSKILEKLPDFVEQGCFVAIKHLLDVYKGTSHCPSETIAKFYQPDPQKVAELEIKLWHKYLAGFDKAIAWIENAHKLQCTGIISLGLLHKYRFMRSYLTSRAAGINHQESVATMKASQQNNQPAISFSLAAKPDELYNEGVKQLKAKDFITALNFFERALEASVTQYGKLSQFAGQCYSSITSCYRDLGDYAKALQACDMAINIFSFGNPDHLANAVTKYRQCLALQKPKVNASLIATAMETVNKHQHTKGIVLFEYILAHSSNANFNHFATDMLRSARDKVAPAPKPTAP